MELTGESIERVVDIYESVDTVKCQKPKSEISSHGNLQDQQTERKCYKLTTGCLVLLSIILLATIIFLCIKFNNLSTQTNQLQIRYTNLTSENNQLKSSFTNLTTENNQLQNRYTNLSTQTNQLQIRYTNLTTENNQLQNRYTNLTSENNQLQTRYTNLTTENNQLQTRYTNLTTENNQLQTRYTNLTTENNQLQTRYTNLTTENNQLQTRYTNLTTENNQLQKQMDGINTWLEARGWRKFRSSYYLISTATKNWNDGRNACINESADLVIINSKEEQDFINTQLKTSGAWIGLSDRATEGNWKWVDDTAMINGFKNWSQGEPNNATANEDCAYIRQNGNVYDWIDSNCFDSGLWICEISVALG